MRALDAATGAQLWRYQLGGPFARLAVYGVRVYLVSQASRLYMLDAATGHEMWQAPLDQGIFNSTTGSRPYLSTPAVDQDVGMVIMVGANGVEASGSGNGRSCGRRISPMRRIPRLWTSPPSQQAWYMWRKVAWCSAAATIRRPAWWRSATWTARRVGRTQSSRCVTAMSTVERGHVTGFGFITEQICERLNRRAALRPAPDKVHFADCLPNVSAVCCRLYHRSDP